MANTHTCQGMQNNTITALLSSLHGNFSFVIVAADCSHEWVDQEEIMTAELSNQYVIQQTQFHFGLKPTRIVL